MVIIREPDEVVSAFSKIREQYNVVGKDHPTIAAEEKVRGECQYVNDISLPNMLHGKILRSPYAHALVKGIYTERAARLPGVKAIITGKDPDIAGRLLLRIPGIHFTRKTRLQDSHPLEEELRYVGDRVAAVAAISPEIAEEALELIEVEYEMLPAVFDPIEAMKPGAPVVHQKVMIGSKEVGVGNNVFGETPMAIGNVDEGFRQADLLLLCIYFHNKMITHSVAHVTIFAHDHSIPAQHLIPSIGGAV